MELNTKDFYLKEKKKKELHINTLKQFLKNLKKMDGIHFRKRKYYWMKRGEQQITTEPGLQCELSGAPLNNIHEVCNESSKFLKEIKQASKG